MGHSSDVPPGQGTKQFDVASSKLLPQYNEPGDDEDGSLSPGDDGDGSLAPGDDEVGSLAPGDDEDGSVFGAIRVGSLFGTLGVGSLSGKSTQDVKE